MNRNFLGVMGMLLYLMVGVSCKGPAPQNQMGGPVPVNMQKVQTNAASYFDMYPGNIIALNEVQLRSEVSGYITGIYFKEGQPVRKGQKLYEIDRSRYAANYAQAEAAVNIAHANLEKVQKDVERYSMLAKKEAISKQRLDYAQTDFKNAKQQIASAEADLRKANLDLQHSLIIAPFDGTIGISAVKMGTFVTPGQTILNTISSDDPIAVDFAISEKEIPRFGKLKEKKLSPKDSVFTILLPDKSIYEFPGEIEFLDRAVDPQTGTLKVRLRFPNGHHILRSGMSCNVRVLNNTGSGVILVPFKAVTEQMGEFYVYVVEQDTARQRKVALGPSVGSDVIIYSGIKPGEEIVTEGLQKLREGTPVHPGTPQQNMEKDKTASK